MSDRTFNIGDAATLGRPTPTNPVRIIADVRAGPGDEEVRLSQGDSVSPWVSVRYVWPAAGGTQNG